MSDHSVSGRFRATAVIAATIAAAACAALPAWAAKPNKADTSRTARDDAVRSIPLEKLDADARAEIKSVLDNVSLFRRLPVQVTRVDPVLYKFMIDHPDVTVDMWRALDLTELSVIRTGDESFKIDDGNGTRGDARFLYRSHDTHLVVTDGSYDGPLFSKPIRGRVLMLLKTGYVREPNGDYYVTSRLDSFIRLDNAGVEFLAKTFQPLVGRIIDENFIEATKFLGSLSRTAELNPEGTVALVERLKNASPEDQRTLSTLLADIGDRARLQASAAPLEADRAGRAPRGATPPRR
jgi:hypothetical protein